MSEDEYNELIAIIGMASETNRLATALGIPIDDCYLV
jgi:alkylhydroperoxidase family enzyme